MASVIELKNVTVELDSRLVLEDLDCEVGDKQLVVVFGPNGAGKTTLLRLLIGQLEPTRGQVLLLGKSVAQSKSEVGYVPQYFQNVASFPISALKAVLMGRFGRIGLLKRATRRDFEIARSALETVGLSDCENRVLGELSGGQRQRVFIARALAAEPKLLLLDEATSGVDVGAKESLYQLLARLKKQMTVLFVTHDMSVVSQDVDMVLCLDRRLVSHGKPEEALNQQALKAMYGAEVAFFAHCNFPHVHAHKHE